MTTKKIKSLKKIERTNLFSFSFPDDIADKIRKIEKGKKSDIAEKAFRKYFAEQEGTASTPARMEIVSNMTKEEILKRFKDYLMSEFHEKADSFLAKLEAARKQEDYARFAVFRKDLPE